jgi:hypothetical protein
LKVVIGTTGWQVHEPALRALADTRGLGVLASANFSLGMTVFRMIVEEARGGSRPRAASGRGFTKRTMSRSSTPRPAPR